jgi:anaerobic selenocysteine-containing dehydrogenase
MTQTGTAAWHKTACILCSINCGIEIQLDEPTATHIERVRGDRSHPVSLGYTCNKPLKLDYYQNAADRLRAPMRRRSDGTFEEIDWDTAIAEIAQKFTDIKVRYGGETILYYGGGGQGNHLGGLYGDSTLQTLGSRYRSNALAQEKTGEFWVGGKMLGAGTHPDIEHAEVSVFVGKNPWMSHGFARARVVLKEIEKDPQRSMVVIDPRRSETAAMADFHLAIKPGTDAWCLAALVAILVQENLTNTAWLAEHTTGSESVQAAFIDVSVSQLAQTCGVSEDLLRATARRIASASSVAVYEDIGMQMSVHSTLGSYLQRLIWLLTGNFARRGTSNAFTPLMSLAAPTTGNAATGKRDGAAEKRSPVVGARIITGLIPCNVIPDEILTDHPKRYRAMLVESGNPVHSIADSHRMREALQQLDLVVVMDVAMTETGRLAHYVLPSPSQFEKYEATFFNLEFPRNVFHLRRPVIDPPPGLLPEPEIHARLVEALGAVPAERLDELRVALEVSRAAFAAKFFASLSTDPAVARNWAYVLYRTLGPTLPHGAASAAVLWATCHSYVQKNRQAAARAGFDGDAFAAGEKLFAAVLEGPVTFAVEDYGDNWKRVGLPEHKINLLIPEMLSEFKRIEHEPLVADRDFPLILSAGERRAETANTIYRNPAWRSKEKGSLRMSAGDADRLGLIDGGPARLSTARASVDVVIEVSPMMQPGHVSLPNGLGLTYRPSNGTAQQVGVAPNDLTSGDRRDFLAGTPWHKHVPARVERLSETTIGK